jgi:uncharacterized protein involved in response to NO
MPVLPLVDPDAPAIRGFALFEAGFRVFFLLAPLYAAVAVFDWVLAYSGLVQLPIAISPTLWHAHEMIFGFAGAGVAGFFLTAVPNWTGARFVRGLPLMSLAAVWLLGRIAMCLVGLVPPVLAAVADLAFLPLLAVLVAPPLLKGGIGRNSVLLVVLAVLWLADLAMQLEFAGSPLAIEIGSAARGARAGINILTFLITVIGGRIVPAFTTTRLKLEGAELLPRSFALLDRMTIAAMALVLIAELITGDSKLTGIVALVAALAQALRLFYWRGLATTGTPILWILHLGYAWLVLGLVLKGAAAFTDGLPETAALHALTVGAIGTMLTAIMSRAALGHTGRKIDAHPMTVGAYGLISLAALLRVAAPLLPAMLPSLMIASGLAWSLAFALFLAVYAPILVRPRVDGQPG